MNLAQFEEIEQEIGYEPADGVLRLVAHGLSALTRVSDVVSRYRRTGFGILLPESDQTGVDVALSRISDRIEDLLEGATANTAKTRLSLAFGSAIYPDDGEDTASLILAAEQRLLASEADIGVVI